MRGDGQTLSMMPVEFPHPYFFGPACSSTSNQRNQEPTFLQTIYPDNQDTSLRKVRSVPFRPSATTSLTRPERPPHTAMRPIALRRLPLKEALSALKTGEGSVPLNSSIKGLQMSYVAQSPDMGTR